MRSLRHWMTLVESGQHPTVTIPESFHVGTLDISQKRKDSHEGAGLSISLHPNAWRSIARGFVGGELWRVTKPGAQFLDYHRLSKDQKKEMVSWGVEHGYVVPHTAYRVSYFDDEIDKRIGFYCDTREEAEGELESYEGMDPKVSRITSGFRMTPKLQARSNLSGNHYINCYDFLSTVYADDVLGLDGIWWEDDYDPSGLSAPRGVIFPDRIASFTVERVDESEAPDDGEF